MFVLFTLFDFLCQDFIVEHEILAFFWALFNIFSDELKMCLLLDQSLNFSEMKNVKLQISNAFKLYIFT